MGGNKGGRPPAHFAEAGQRFGHLVVLDPGVRMGVTPQKPTGFRAALCQCDCGKTVTVSLNALARGTNKTCGNACDYSPGKMSARTPEGRARAATLGRGRSAEGEARRLASTTRHGLAGRRGRHPLYGTWKGMLARCENPESPGYRRYGGRGIEVYPGWHDVRAFIADIEAEIGPRPAGKHPSGVPLYSLDRIDNNGNYEPGNVRWATAVVQQANTSRPGPSQCSEDDCDRVATSRGMCSMHYRRWRKASHPKTSPEPRQRPECSEDGCTDPAHARGMCNRHYKRQWARDRRQAA